jgi:PGF-CTERM protein
VKAYARIDDEWVPLNESDTQLAEDDVDSDGSFTITVDSSIELNLPDSYRIAVAADPAADIDNDGTNENLIGTTTTLESGEYSDIDTVTTFTVRMAEGDLTANLSSSRIAAGVDDEVTLEGTALGQGDNVRIYLIGPRGDFLDENGNEVTTETGLPTADIDDEEFDLDFSGFENRGTYRFLVIGNGRDGDFASNAGLEGSSQLPAGKTPQQAAAIVEDEYSGAGVDDQIVSLTLSAENPSLSINDFTQNGQVAQGEVEVSGESNREDGTTVFVEVLGQNENVVASGEAEVNGSDNMWSTTLDLSDVETGTYTLQADDDEASESLEFELVQQVEQTGTPGEETGTATEMTETETEMTETETEAPATETETEAPATETGTETATETSTPGFGVIVALVALLAAALLAVRRD